MAAISNIPQTGSAGQFNLLHLPGKLSHVLSLSHTHTQMHRDSCDQVQYFANMVFEGEPHRRASLLPWGCHTGIVRLQGPTQRERNFLLTRATRRVRLELGK